MAITLRPRVPTKPSESVSTGPHRRGSRALALTQPLRRLSQLAFAAFIAFTAIRHDLAGEDSPVVLPEPEAFCPFGGLETLYQYIATGGNLVRHTSLSNVVLAVAVLLTALLARSAFCGWVCPLGFLQDLVSGLSAFLQRRVPGLRRAVRAIRSHGAPLAVLDRPLRLLKYAVLIWSVAGAAAYGFMVFRDYDPWAALLDIGTPALTFGLVVLLVTLVASLFVGRPWCRYACPLGAVSGLLGRLSPVYLAREDGTCKSCTLCARACPMGLPVDRAEDITHADCMGCLECLAACPVKGSLKLKLGFPLLGPKRPSLGLNPVIYGSLALALFMGTIFTAQANGYWSVSRKMPTGANVEEIKGSMMLGDVAGAYGVPLEEIVRAFELPPDTPPAAKVKDLRSGKFSPGSLREWLSQRTGG